MSAMNASLTADSSATWPAGFINILPTLLTHARIQFRRLPAERKEEAIAETVAAACQNYAALVRQGRLGRAFASTLASFATRHVRQDRHIGGHQNCRDVLSPLAQRKGGFAVSSIAARDFYGWQPLVAETRHCSPADTAAFRVDFTEWLKSHTDRDRRIICRLAGGAGTFAVADQFGVTPARISGLRRKYERSWQVFQGDAAGAA